LLGGLDEKILHARSQMKVFEAELRMIENSTHQLNTLIREHRKEMDRLKKLKGNETAETKQMVDKTVDEIVSLRKSGAYKDVKFTATAIEAVTGNIFIHNKKHMTGYKDDEEGNEYIGWYAMGRFLIKMPYNGQTPSITSVKNSKHSRVSGNSHPHPHVNVGGNPCLGTLGNPLKKFLQEGEYALALSALYEFLGTWNYKSPYQSLNSGWTKVDPPGEKEKEKVEQKEIKDATVPIPA
jgi:hypothetical protein